MGNYGGNEENSIGLIMVTFLIAVLCGRNLIYIILSTAAIDIIFAQNGKQIDNRGNTLK
jgi:hypothetical protein